MFWKVYVRRIFRKLLGNFYPLGANGKPLHRLVCPLGVVVASPCLRLAVSSLHRSLGQSHDCGSVGDKRVSKRIPFPSANTLPEAGSFRELPAFLGRVRGEMWPDWSDSFVGCQNRLSSRE